MNPAGERKVERFGWTFAPGDKVMQIVVLVGQKKAVAIAVRKLRAAAVVEAFRMWSIAWIIAPGTCSLVDPIVDAISDILGQGQPDLGKRRAADREIDLASLAFENAGSISCGTRTSSCTACMPSARASVLNNANCSGTLALLPLANIATLAAAG
jgi:hypothetical protein